MCSQISETFPIRAAVAIVATVAVVTVVATGASQEKGEGLPGALANLLGFNFWGDW